MLDLVLRLCRNTNEFGVLNAFLIFIVFLSLGSLGLGGWEIGAFCSLFLLYSQFQKHFNVLMYF